MLLCRWARYLQIWRPPARLLAIIIAPSPMGLARSAWHYRDGGQTKRELEEKLGADLAEVVVRRQWSGRLMSQRRASVEPTSA